MTRRGATTRSSRPQPCPTAPMGRMGRNLTPRMADRSVRGNLRSVAYGSLPTSEPTSKRLSVRSHALASPDCVDGGYPPSEWAACTTSPRLRCRERRCRCSTVQGATSLPPAVFSIYRYTYTPCSLFLFRPAHFSARSPERDRGRRCCRGVHSYYFLHSLSYSQTYYIIVR